jgi:hypothetical protein
MGDQGRPPRGLTTGTVEMRPDRNLDAIVRRRNLEVRLTDQLHCDPLCRDRKRLWIIHAAGLEREHLDFIRAACP